MRAIIIALLTSAIIAIPAAQATDLLHPQVCDPTIGCIAPGVCAVGLVCPSTPCDAVGSCSAQAYASPTTCAVNATIHGTTCVTEAGASTSFERELGLPVFGPVGATGAGLDLAFVQGSVTDFNLPNSWLTPIATTRIDVLGLPLGETTVGVYRSDIITPGQARFPEITGANHTFSQTTLEAQQRGGQAGDVELAIALLSLDSLPDGCFVRTSIGAAREFNCPRIGRLLP